MQFGVLAVGCLVQLVIGVLEVHGPSARNAFGISVTAKLEPEMPDCKAYPPTQTREQPSKT